MNILGRLSIKWKIAMLLTAPISGLVYSTYLTDSWIPIAFATIGIIAGLIVQHSICKSLFEVQQTLKGIAEGNYNPLTITTNDEVGQLRHILESVQHSVNESRITNRMNSKLDRLTPQARQLTDEKEIEP